VPFDINIAPGPGKAGRSVNDLLKVKGRGREEEEERDLKGKREWTGVTTPLAS